MVHRCVGTDHMLLPGDVSGAFYTSMMRSGVFKDTNNISLDNCDSEKNPCKGWDLL